MPRPASLDPRSYVPRVLFRMAGEKVTATKRKAGGKVVIKKRTKKFRRHQSDQFMRVPVRAPPRVLCLPQSVLCS